MAEDAVADPARGDPVAWKILVVDDEPAIHQVTKLALRNLSVLGRPSQLINALSAKDAREQLALHPDIAVVLLDVVMETEDAGLEFIKHIREQVGNPLIRIILRTGQPGQAPERQVMVDYDINDYKEKTELTASKLFTTVMSSIRTFAHLQAMVSCGHAVEVLGHMNAEVFAATDIHCLGSALVAQLNAMELFSAIACWTDGSAAATTDTPDYAIGTNSPDEDRRALLQQALDASGTLVARAPHYAAALAMDKGQTLAVCLRAPQALSTQSCRLLELWLRSAKVALAHWVAA